jgi:hypothetical protein
VVWILLALLAVILAAVAVAVRGRATGAPPPGAAPEPQPGRLRGDDVLGLHPGALICHRGAEYLVERSLHFSENGCEWAEHRLSDNRSGRSLTLEVEEAEPMRLCVYERLPESATPPEGERLYREGADYEFSERGLAEYRTQERAGAGKRGRMAYVEFVAGRERIAYSCYDDGDWEVSRGEAIALADLELPAR